MKKHKLTLSRSTIRNLSLRAGVAGGISGRRQCHTLADLCSGGGSSGGVTCNSDATDCPSGFGVATCTG
jgi:hypothetical protein